jgi:hypothetical protein
MIDRAIRRELAALLRDRAEWAAQPEKDRQFLLILAEDCEERARYAPSAMQERWTSSPQERSVNARRRRATAAAIRAIASVWSAVKVRNRLAASSVFEFIRLPALAPPRMRSLIPLWRLRHVSWRTQVCPARPDTPVRQPGRLPELLLSLYDDDHTSLRGLPLPSREVPCDKCGFRSNREYGARAASSCS